MAFGPVRGDGKDDSPGNGSRVIRGCSTVFFSSCSPGGHVGTDVSPQFPDDFRGSDEALPLPWPWLGFQRNAYKGRRQRGNERRRDERIWSIDAAVRARAHRLFCTSAIPRHRTVNSRFLSLWSSQRGLNSPPRRTTNLSNRENESSRISLVQRSKSFI